VGWGRGADKFAGGRFSSSRTVFSEEYGRPLVDDNADDGTDE
jgi:hypothetical protein